MLFIVCWFVKTLQQNLKLRSFQKKVIRFILNLGPMSRIDNPTLDKVNMLCVNDSVRQLRLNHFHDIVHNRAPKYLYHIICDAMYSMCQ